MNFKIGKIEGVKIKELVKFTDERGWLMELFRKDEIHEETLPLMCYISLTIPEVIRGPHEHKEQTDYFCCFSSKFKLFLWDNRAESKTYKNKITIKVAEDNPKIVIVPPRVVHAYKNIGNKPGLVINLPNKLFAGWGKKGEVDEVRYEDDPNSIFKVD